MKRTQLLLLALTVASSIGLTSCFGVMPPGQSFNAPDALQKIASAAAPMVVYEIKANAESFLDETALLSLAANENAFNEASTAADAATTDWKQFGAKVAAAGVVEAANLWLKSQGMPTGQTFRLAPKQSPPSK